jgi:hypothetical protein
MAKVTASAIHLAAENFISTSCDTRSDLWQTRLIAAVNPKIFFVDCVSHRSELARIISIYCRVVFRLFAIFTKWNDDQSGFPCPADVTVYLWTRRRAVMVDDAAAMTVVLGVANLVLKSLVT